MKNDILLKSFAQKGVKAISPKESIFQASKLSPLDSGQLATIKGGNTGEDDIMLGN